MNFVNQAYSQLVDLFRSMTPAARITSALLLAVVVIGLAYLFRLQTSGTEEYLYGGREFSQDELGSMETAFAKAGLNKSEIVGNRMRVPRGFKDKYLAALADGDAWPKGFGDETEKANKSSSPFESGKAQDNKQRLARQKDLSRIISKMSGIRTATVQFDEIDKGWPKRKERSALVAVQPEGNSPLDEERVRAIRATVVGAFAGLEAANVAVTDLGSGRTHPGVGADGHVNSESKYDQLKRIYERTTKEKIIDLLSIYPGVVVGVNVELNTELDTHTQSTIFQPKTVPISSTDISEENTSTTPGPGGRPGSVPNGVGPGSNAPAQVATSSVGAQTQSTKTRNDQKAIASSEQTSIHKLGLTPKHFTASIALPTSYFTKVWREQHPTPPGTPAKEPDAAELRKIEDDTRSTIEKSVVSLFPPVEKGTDKYPQVTVTTYTDLPRPPEVPPSTTDKATSWIAGNWQTVALVVVGLFSLVMLRGMLRPGPSASPAAAAAEGTPAPQLAAIGGDDEAGDEDAPPARKRRFRSTGSSLRDELTDMVKEDPSAAVNVLRNWIGDAA